MEIGKPKTKIQYDFWQNQLKHERNRKLDRLSQLLKEADKVREEISWIDKQIH